MPPVRRDADMETGDGSSASTSYSSEAEIRSRVLRGPGGGDKQGANSGSVVKLHSTEHSLGMLNFGDTAYPLSLKGMND